MRFSKAMAVNVLISLMVALTFSGIAFATDFNSTNFIIRDPIFAPAGGVRSTSSSFQQIGSAGQPVIGEGTSTNFILRSGFGYFAQAGASTLVQSRYAWYDNINAIQPTTVRAAENTKVNIASGEVLRLRVGIRATGEPFPSASIFKLQFADRGNIATCAGIPTTSFVDLGPASSSAALWVGYDNLSVADGAQISALLLSTAAGVGGSRQTYEESNNTASTPLVIFVGPNADAEWDWSLKYRGTNSGLDYCFRMLLSDGTLLGNYSVYPTVTVAAAAPTPSSGGGGGSGGFSTIIPSSSGAAASAPAATPAVVPPVTATTTPGKTEVIFNGKTSPNAKLTLLKDGAAVGSFTASESGEFIINLPNVDVGRYNFVLYGDDSKGVRSGSFTKSVDVIKDKSTKVENVVIAPTVGLNKSKVKYGEKGETVLVSGQTYPLAKVKIVVSGKSKLSVQKTADKNGQYSYVFDAGTVEKGDYTFQVSVDTTVVSQAVNLNVGNETVLSAGKVAVKYDLNGDSQVNLVDFSILAFWYNKPAPADAKQLDIFKKLDLNGDAKIDLKDFSILVSGWTG